MQISWDTQAGIVHYNMGWEAGPQLGPSCAGREVQLEIEFELIFL